MRTDNLGPPDNLGKLRKLIAAWRQFVNDVERGYTFGIYEYDNDLSVRNRIQAMLDEKVVPDTDLADTLSQADERFRALLVPTLRPLVDNASPDAFWYYGLPRSAGEELLKDAHSYGLLE